MALYGGNVGITPSVSALGGMGPNDELRKKRFEDVPNQNRFFEMKQQRDAQRLEYIRQGVLPDPDKAQDLSAAKSLTGTCMEMCPEFERVEREFQNEGDALEMYPGSNRIDSELAVKIYRRPAAGRELPLPEDVRPPIVLRQTLDYLFHQLLPSDPASAQFTVVQPFMWNRTRAIRQDFIVQGLRGPLEIECHERIARYHILCLHWKGGVGAEGWSEQQELEQLRKTIRSLTEFYEDLRKSSGESSPNEAEFRAYNLLLHMQDPETLREVELLPSKVFDSPSIQAALRLRGYAQRSNNVIRRGRPLNTESTMNLWTRFFGEIKNSKDVTYLLACLAENSFSQVRAGAIKAMGKTYLSQHTPLPLEYLRRSMGMDTEEEGRSFAAALNCEEVRTGGPDAPVTAMRLAKANEDKPLPIAPFSKTIVEIKRGQRTSQDIVDGKLSGSAPLIPMIEAEGKQGTSKRNLNKLVRIPTPTVTPTIPLSSVFSTASVPASSPSFKSESSLFASTSSPFSAPLYGSSLSATAPRFTPSTSALPKSPIESTNASITKGAAAPMPVPVSTSEQLSVPAQTTFEFKDNQSPSLNFLSKEISTAFKSPLTESAPDSFNGTKEIETTSKTTSKGVSNPIAPNATTSLVKSTISPALSHHVKFEEQTKEAPVQKTVIPTRTINSVTSSLMVSLIQEFLDHKLNSISQQAFLREMRIRRKEFRAHVVDEVVHNLLRSLEVELIDDAVIALASETLADEFRVRSLENLVLRGRQRAVTRAVERRTQQERLRKVRSELEERGLSVYKINSQDHQSVVHKRTPVHLPISAMEDEELQDRLRKAKEERQNLWTPNTFVDTIGNLLGKAAPADLHTWTVGLCLCQDAEVTSQWIRRKMGVEDTPLYEDLYRDGDHLRVLDLEKQSSEVLQNEREIGLIVFEMSPSSNLNNNKAVDGWGDTRQRLQQLSQQSFTTQGRFHPKLLLICWSPISALQQEERMRRIIFRELELGATNSQRYWWSQVEICYLGSEISTPQASFDKSVSRILELFPRNHQSLRLNLDATSNMCKASWKVLLEHIQTAALSIVENGETIHNKQLALQIFRTVTLLANRTLKDLVSISDTLLDVQDESGYPQLSIVPLNEEIKDEIPFQQFNILDLLFEVATLQLQESHQNSDDETILMLQSWLLEESRSSFPWMAYFERLYQWHLNQLEDVWLECKMPLGRKDQLQLETTSTLCQSAWTEIEQKLRALTLNRFNSTIKKRSIEEAHLKENGIVTKSRRTDSHPNRLHTTTTTTLSSSSSSSSSSLLLSSSHEVNSLRALMASASQLLDQP